MHSREITQRFVSTPQISSFATAPNAPENTSGNSPPISPRPRPGGPQATGAALAPRARPPQVEPVEPPPLPGVSDLPAPLLDAHQTQQLAKASSVWVLGYSSTGAGHTARCFEPIIELVRRGKIGKSDVVCIALPEQWPHDKGAAKRTLEHYLRQLERSSINCIVTQTDKTITGLYKPCGASDNPAILADFARKPMRQVPNPEVQSIRPGGPVMGHSANEMLRQIVRAAGDAGKCHVLSDMGVYVTKAARLVGIPADHIVEISNHALLLDPSIDHGGRSLSILSKVTAADHAGRLGLFTYDAHTNTVATMKATLDRLGVTPHTAKQEVRNRVVAEMMQHGRLNSLSTSEPVSAGILVAPGRRPEDIDGLVYFYVNEYTRAAGNFVRERLQNQDPDYSKTLFVICGPTTFRDHRSRNALHMAYAAHADGMTNAGFGVTSEVHYLMRHGFQGQVLLLPVEDQHEQQANARMLHHMLSSGIAFAHDPSDMRDHLDALVRSRTRTGELRSHMSSLLRAVNNPHTYTHHIARILNGARMSPQEAALLQRGHEIANDPDTKAFRRGAKAIVTALQGVTEQMDLFEIRMTTKQVPSLHSIRSLAEQLRNDDQCAALFGNIDAGGPATQEFRRMWASRLMQMDEAPVTERKQMARNWLAELGDAYVLGF